MKIGIVSDTHSNLFALEKVLEHMNGVGVDLKVHLGDCVGYGSKPNETLALTLKNFNYIVKGNHDLAVYDLSEAEYFNPQAKRSTHWTHDKLSSEELDVLENLSYGHLINDMLFVHGSPQANNPHGYLIRQSDAVMAFSDPVVDFKVAFVGHTHQPFVWYEDSYFRVSSQSYNFNEIGSVVYPASSKGRTIFNVGSVGQPRDNDPRASYLIYDTENRTATFYKIPYDIDRAVASMQRNGFLNTEYERLIYGR